MSDDYTRLDPRTAIDHYLAARQSELAESTLASHGRRLRLFARWCGDNDIDAICDVEPSDIHEYSVWRQEGIRSDGISPETLRSALMTLRVFLRWAASAGACDASLPETMVIPETATRRCRDEMLESERADELLNKLSRYEYASDTHVLMKLMWGTGLRVGTVRALDVGDVDRDEQCVRVRHRPATDTPLKNQAAAERAVALRDDTYRVVTDYIDERRIDVVDEYNREPLISTQQGRRSRSSYRRKTYYETLPCRVSGECPEGKDPDSCEWNSWRGAPQCPESVATHAIRRGSITHHLREGVPVEVVSDRMDVSHENLEHYNRMTETESMKVRRDYL